jgi:hypothetical protein
VSKKGTGLKPADDTLYVCNYNMKDLHCELIDSASKRLNAFQRKVNIFPSQNLCEESCSNLIRDGEATGYSNRLAADQERIVRNFPALFRVIRTNEVESLETQHKLEWKSLTRKQDTSYVHGWITRGSQPRAEGRVQYGSFSTIRGKLDNDKYHAQGKNFIEVNTGNLVEWAKSQGKVVRLPKRSDLTITFDRAGFPKVEVKQDRDAVIILPLAFPEWQNFFFPTLHDYSRPKRDYSDGQNVHPFDIYKPGMDARAYTITDAEAVIVTHKLPIELISVSKGITAEPDPTFKEKFKRAKGVSAQLRRPVQVARVREVQVKRAVSSTPASDKIDRLNAWKRNSVFKSSAIEKSAVGQREVRAIARNRNVQSNLPLHDLAETPCDTSAGPRLSPSLGAQLNEVIRVSREEKMSPKQLEHEKYHRELEAGRSPSIKIMGDDGRVEYGIPVSGRPFTLGDWKLDSSSDW